MWHESGSSVSITTPWQFDNNAWYSIFPVPFGLDYSVATRNATTEI